jgi:hypothetical protein
MEQIEPVKSKEGTKKNKPQLTPEEKKKRQQMYSRTAYDKHLATHGRVRKHKKTAKQLQTQQQKLEEKQLEEENQFLIEALLSEETDSLSENEDHSAPVLGKKRGKQSVKQSVTAKKRAKPTPEEKLRQEELKKTLSPEEYRKTIKRMWKDKNKLTIAANAAKFYEENKEILNKERVERGRRQRQFAQNMIEVSEALGPNNMNAGPMPTQEHNANYSLSNNMNAGPDYFNTYVPTQEHNANYSLSNNMNAGPDYFNTYVPSQEDNANYSLPNNMNTGPDAFENYVPRQEDDANSSLFEDYFSDIENAKIELEDVSTRKQRTLPTPEEKLLQEELKKILSPEEYIKALKKLNKEKNKSRKKQQDKKRYEENKEILNKERVERGRRQRQFAKNIIALSEALGPNNMNAGPDAFETYVPSHGDDANSSFYEDNFSDIEETTDPNAGYVPTHEYDANYSLPNNMNAGPDAFNTYVASHGDDANSSFYDGLLSDIEEEPIEDLNGGRKTRKRRKTLKRGKKNRHTRNNSRK